MKNGFFVFLVTLVLVSCFFSYSINNNSALQSDFVAYELYEELEDILYPNGPTVEELARRLEGLAYWCQKTEGLTLKKEIRENIANFKNLLFTLAHLAADEETYETILEALRNEQESLAVSHDNFDDAIYDQELSLTHVYHPTRLVLGGWFRFISI